MAFTPSRFILTLSKKSPSKHSKHYADTPVWRKKENDKYVVDIDKYDQYFEEPFKNSEDLFEIELSYDNSIISDDGRINIRIPRDKIDNYDTSQFNYAKVTFYYDVTSEEIYLWTISKKIISESLSFILFTFAFDFIPSYLKFILKQKLWISMFSRSFHIFKNPSLSFEEEKKIRNERLKYNIICDEKCESKSMLLLNNHFTKQDGDPDYYMALTYKVKIPSELGDKNYTTGTLAIKNENGIIKNVPLETYSLEDRIQSINFTPIYFGNNRVTTINDDDATAKCSLDGKPAPLSTFSNSINRFNNLSSLRNTGETCLPNYFTEDFEPENTRLFIYQPSRFASDVRSYEKQMNLKFKRNDNYDNLKENIPYHFIHLHSKYFLRSTQEDIYEVEPNIVFFNGYDSSQKDKWISDFKIILSRRMTTTSVFYDIYWDNENNALNNYFSQVDIKPLGSFEFWGRLYTNSTDLERYLKENQERRKVDRQSEIVSNTTSAIKSILIGAGTGAAFGGVVGAAVGAFIGILTYSGSFLISQLTGTDYEGKDRALLQDLRNRSTSIPNTLSGEFLSFYDLKETQKMHPTSFFITEAIGFAWEWKFNFTNFSTYGEASKKQLENLINFGERVNNDFYDFDLFDFIVNSKTDIDIFYLKTKECRPLNEVFYSNIIPDVQITFCEFLNSGTRFRFFDE